MNKAIDLMKNSIIDILGNSLQAIYIYGSIVLDDFKLGWSDIDILCLTKTKITEEHAGLLLYLRQALLKEYENNPYFRSFEGAFLTTEAFINNSSDNVVYWGTSGESIKNTYALDPFSTMELIDSGKLLYGEDIRSSFIYPARASVIKAIKFHYETIRKYAITTSTSLYSAGWLLDIARCIYTLRTGRIIGKTAAGIWALENQLVPDVDIMEKVILIRKEPLKYRDDKGIQSWLASLGPFVQKFADVLEKELVLSEH